MNDLRFQVKVKLLEQANYQPICPMCSRRATQLHEIVCPIQGNKYQPDPNDPIAQAVYKTELCMLLCDHCNGSIGTGISWRDDLILTKMKACRSEEERARIIQALRDLAALLKHPGQYLPRSIFLGGKIHQVL
jgi:hypothetical protein